MENEMERNFRYGIGKIPEWNGRFQEWNGRQSTILPYQCHILDFVHCIYKKYLRMSDSDK